MADWSITESESTSNEWISPDAPVDNGVISEFSVRYMGTKSSDPQSGYETGSMYYNSSSNEMRIYNGASWQILKGNPGPQGDPGSLATGSVVISVSEWAEESATVFIVTVSAEGVTASNVVLIGGPTTIEQMTAAADACVVCTGQGSGTLTFSAARTPVIDITYSYAIQ